MIQFNRSYVENENYITNLINEARKILTKRKEDYDRYCKKTGVPIERYIATTGTSYFAGKTPVISVKKELDKEKVGIIEKIFNKIIANDLDNKEFQVMLDYINEYNDLPAFFYGIAKDYFITNACYWLTYETNDNEIVYAQTSALQCVALYDYSTPVQLIGGLRLYDEVDDKGNLVNVAVLTLPNERRYYRNGSKVSNEYKEDINMREGVNWELTPFYAVENPDGLSLFDSVKGLIDKLEQVLTNESNTYQYNDDAKLFVPGYSPVEDYLDEEGNINQKRIKEDKCVLEAPVFYDPQGTNKPEWIIKDVNDTAVMNFKKTLVDYIFMLAMIPNMNDISFTNSDSGKAIESKFFGLEQVLIEAEKLFKKELLRMYENIVARINVEKNTKYDFRQIDIKLTRNLPVSKEDITNMWLGLRELISDETIIKNLPLELDAESEIAKKEEQSEERFNNAVQNAKNLSEENQEEEVEETEV